MFCHTATQSELEVAATAGDPPPPRTVQAVCCGPLAKQRSDNTQPRGLLRVKIRDPRGEDRTIELLGRFSLNEWLVEYIC